MDLLALGRLLSGAALACLLAACATPAQHATAPGGGASGANHTNSASASKASGAPGGERSAFRNTLEAEGRLSVRYERNGREEASHVGFQWSQQPEHLIVTLRSPLGQTMAVLTVRPGEATLSQSGEPTRSAPDIDSLANEALGWPLPIGGLADWLQGYVRTPDGRRTAIPAEPASFDAADGWKLAYGEWQTGSDGARYPRRIDLSRQTQAAGPVTLRIVIDSWQ